jgi:hypothetical protein
MIMLGCVAFAALSTLALMTGRRSGAPMVQGQPTVTRMVEVRNSLTPRITRFSFHGTKVAPALYGLSIRRLISFD